MIEKLKQEKIMAILRGVSSTDIVEVGQAIVEGGIRFAEITLDHHTKDGLKESLRSISLLREHFGDQLSIGAGTVLNVEEVKEAVGAGAEYILSPVLDLEVIEKTKTLNKISIPAAFTPTEMYQAYNAGGDIIKLFPASVLGPAYIRSLLSPLPMLPILAVGGINKDNMMSYLDLDIIGVGVGDSLISQKFIHEKNFIGIKENVIQMVSQIEK